MKKFKIALYITLGAIIWPMVGYKILIVLLDKIFNIKDNPKVKQEPNISIIIAAHNEEKVIAKKLENLISLDYPHDKMEIIIASDNSTDSTNKVVENFIEGSKLHNIKLFKVQERKGKTNAQNEAVRQSSGDILIFSDANSMIEKNAINELVSSFYDETIMYVSGDLCYINHEDNSTSTNENTYWNIDKAVRNIESKLSSITAGNGALYAIRKKYYIEIDPIHSHDSKIPREAVLMGLRAISNKEAKVYEKAGETVKDEYKRKVRMNRVILEAILETKNYLNIFKYKFFTIQYISHRTLRYLLAVNHVLLYIVNLFLLKDKKIYKLLFYSQNLFYFFALLGSIINNKYLKLCYYYTITLIAQLHGILNYFTGKRKPFWEKAESTR